MTHTTKENNAIAYFTSHLQVTLGLSFREQIV